MTRLQLVQLSKLLALMLRHQPERFGITLDAEGYASLDEVLQALRTAHPRVTIDDLQQMVAELEPDKQRFSIGAGEIRANYGHSLAARIAQSPALPPQVLLHGTACASLASIRANGLKPMRRQYVHLTTEQALALRIGSRHGAACVLTIAAAEAGRAGVQFYKANASFWLADAIPAQFICDCATQC